MKTSVLIGMVALGLTVQAATQVVPPSLANVEGNGRIGMGFGSTIPTRVQVVYGASLFGNLGAGDRRRDEDRRDRPNLEWCS